MTNLSQLGMIPGESKNNLTVTVQEQYETKDRRSETVRAASNNSWTNKSLEISCIKGNSICRTQSKESYRDSSAGKSVNDYADMRLLAEPPFNTYEMMSPTNNSVSEKMENSPIAFKHPS